MWTNLLNVGGCVGIDNYNNSGLVIVDPSDIIKRWWLMVLIRDEKQGKTYTMYPTIINTFNLQKTEKVQIVESFGETTHIYAFGRHPTQLHISGYVLASNIFNPVFSRTYDALTSKYEELARAYQVAQSGIRVKITGPNINGKGNILLQGIANNFTVQMSAENNSILVFSMNFIEVDTALAIKPKQALTKATGEVKIKQ